MLLSCSLRLLHRAGLAALLAVVTAGSSAVMAHDTPAAEPAKEVKPKLVIEHLDNPSGVAIHPGNGHVFVVSRQGVFRFVPEPGKSGRIYLEVEGFPTDIYGKGPKYNIGPLGVALWGTDRLIVSDGSRPDGEELVRVYKIEEQPPSSPPKPEASAEFTIGPIAPGGEASPKGEGNFYAIAVIDQSWYITANGDDTKGWVLRSTLADGKPGPLEPWLATKTKVEVDAPVAITVSPDKKLVIGQMGEVNVAGDSLLTIYDPATGDLIKSYKTGLHDITGLAYGPGGKLYATDFAWPDTTQGGLFELMIEGEEVKTRKVVSLDRPTALAFDAEGAAYVTVFGVGRETGDKPTGGVLKLAPGF